MKRNLVVKYSLLMLLLTVGIGIFVYPTVAGIWNEYVASLVAADYVTSIEKNGAEYAYEEEWEKASRYNASLPKETSFITADTYDTTDKTYESCLNVNGDGIMGILEIPCISQKLPIYHYTGESELESGVGHILGSSLPTGEIGTCMFTGHSAVAGNPLFTRLDEVAVGDEIYLHIMNKNFAYQVREIKVVLPEEVDSLVLDSEKSLITLITCTPFAINSHRLLVIAERIPYPEEVESVSVFRSIVSSTEFWKLIVGAIAWIGFVTICFVKYEKESNLNHRNRSVALGRGDGTVSVPSKPSDSDENSP